MPIVGCFVASLSLSLLVALAFLALQSQGEWESSFWKARMLIGHSRCWNGAKQQEGTLLEYLFYFFFFLSSFPFPHLTYVGLSVLSSGALSVIRPFVLFSTISRSTPTYLTRRCVSVKRRELRGLGRHRYMSAFGSRSGVKGWRSPKEQQQEWGASERAEERQKKVTWSWPTCHHKHIHIHIHINKR